ncbi:MAG TPA: hypothetical protein VFQ61_09435 [Polyangiaceae bacterium]|nr:hypothetical protein [Polyangiaceae bacterium]
MPTLPGYRAARVLGLLACVGSCLAATQARADIQTPGAHPHYTLDLEPHLALQFDRGWRGEGTGIGPGFRVSLPVVQNGPLKNLNNNLAVGLGLDYTHFRGCDRPGTSGECSVNQYWFPVLAQWNFFFTDHWSAFAELGFSVLHRTIAWDTECPFLDAGQCHSKSFRPLEPVIFVGGRYLITGRFGVVARVGSPYASLGVDFLL